MERNEKGASMSYLRNSMDATSISNALELLYHWRRAYT